MNNNASQLFQPDNFSVSTIRYKTTDVDLTFLKTILEQYFKSFTIIEALRLDRHENNSENYQILVDVSGASSRILLRKFKLLQDKEQITFYLHFLKNLRALGVPVSDVLATRGGELMLVHDNNYYTVFSFIEADYFVPTDAALVSLAQGVATMHKSFNVLPEHVMSSIAVLSKRLNNYFNKVPQYRADDFLRIREIVSKKIEKNVDDEFVLQHIPRCFDLINEVEVRRSEIDALPRQLIHADLHPHNVLFAGDTLRAIIDFDSVRVGEQARDVAFACYRFGRQFFARPTMSSGQAPVKKQFSPNAAQRLGQLFLKEYGSKKPLTPKEIELLPVLLQDDFLRKILFVLRGVYEEGNTAWAKDLPKFFAALEELSFFF